MGDNRSIRGMNPFLYFQLRGISGTSDFWGIFTFSIFRSFMTLPLRQNKDEYGLNGTSGPRRDQMEKPLIWNMFTISPRIWSRDIAILPHETNPV